MKNKELMLHEMEFKKGALDMKLGGEPAQVFLVSLIEFFRQNGGTNFLTLTVADSTNKYAINIENCNGTDTAAEKLQRLEVMANGYKNLAIDLARVIQRLEGEKIELTEDDIKAVWKLKIALGELVPTSVEEGTGSLICNDFNRGC